MNGRCIWCHGEGGSLKEVTAVTPNRLLLRRQERTFLVHAEHEQAFLAFNERVNRFGWLFLGSIVACILAMVALEVVLVAGNKAAAVVGIGALTAVLGAVMVALPFSTPETVAIFGLRRASRIVRTMGAVVIILGAFVVLQGTN